MWKCLFRHVWGKWETLTLRVKAVWEKEWSDQLVQQRTCVRCGRTQTDNIF